MLIVPNCAKHHIWWSYSIDTWLLSLFYLEIVFKIEWNIFWLKIIVFYIWLEARDVLTALSWVEIVVKLVNSWRLVSIFSGSSILDVWQGSDYPFGNIYFSFDFHFIRCKWIMIFLLVYKWNVYYKLAKPTA